MTRAREGDLTGYLVDILFTLERYGATVMVDLAEPAWIRSGDGSIRVDVHAALPASPRGMPARVRIREVWRPVDAMLEMSEYAYELLHPELDYRYALHRHDAERFLRAHGAANHEHCESPLGHAICPHFAGAPVRGAIDGFLRLLGTFVLATTPDCRKLHCLES